MTLLLFAVELEAEVPAAEAEFAAVNPGAVVPWVPDAEDFIPEYCMCRAIARDGSFTCARGYMGSVVTSCSHDVARDCAPNDLDFTGCIPSRSCNRCLDPITIPPGYVWSADLAQWSCAAGYRGEVAERCDSCTTPVILGGCIPFANCLPPEAAF
eukprot:g31304.t1